MVVAVVWECAIFRERPETGTMIAFEFRDEMTRRPVAGAEFIMLWCICANKAARPLSNAVIQAMLSLHADCPDVLLFVMHHPRGCWLSF